MTTVRCARARRRVSRPRLAPRVRRASLGGSLSPRARARPERALTCLAPPAPHARALAGPDPLLRARTHARARSNSRACAHAGAAPRSAVSQILSETVAWDSADYNMGALTSSNPGNPVINAAAAAERRARLSITSDGDGARDSVGSYSSRASSVFAEQDAAAGLDSPDAPQVPLSRTVPGRMGSLLSGSSSRASPLDGSEGQGPQRSRSRLSRESDSSPLSAMALPRIRVTGAGARAAAALPAALGAKAAALAARLPSAGGSSGASSSLAAMLPSVPDAAPSEPAAPVPTSAAAPSAAAPGATGAADADQGVMRERQQSREKVGSWIASNASMGDGVAEVDAEGVPDLSAAAEASGESTEAIDAAYDAGGNTDMREAAVVRAPCGVRELGARWLAHAAARELSLAAGARVWAPGEWASVTAGADGSEADVGAVFERTVSFVQPISSPFVKVDSTRVEVREAALAHALACMRTEAE